MTTLRDQLQLEAESDAHSTATARITSSSSRQEKWTVRVVSARTMLGKRPDRKKGSRLPGRNFAAHALEFGHFAVVG